MKKVLLIVAVATMFFSCQKEIEPTNPANSNKGFTFTAGIENLATKAEINSSNELVWASGDQIGVFGATWDDKNQLFTLDGDGGSTTGTFNYDNGEFTATDASFAFFPWNTENNGSDNGNMYFHLDDIYDYTSGKMLTPLVATLAYDATAGKYPPIEFKHAGAAVKVSVSNLPAGAHSICLAADQPVAGWFNVAMSAAGTGSIVPNSSNVVSNSVWINFAPAAAEREFTFLFPVPALTAPKFSFQMYDENNVLVWKKNLKAQENDLERGDVLVMPVLDITPYAQLDQISVWGVCGTHNSWNGDTPMVCEVDGNIHIAKGLELAEGAEFKIRKNGDWEAGQYGSNNLVANSFSQGLEGGNIRITQGGTYDIILDSSEHKVKVVSSKCPYPDAGTMPHHTSIKKAKDLGATETANCYIITAPGAYKIPVVKGNSTESAGTVGGVQLLWETYNNASDVAANSVIAAVDYDEDIPDYIFFKTPDTLQPGNALIAAKDANGDIIWSWHIWIPETAIANIGDYSVSKKYLMDRNLGAVVPAVVPEGDGVVDVRSVGLYYQWGRKDPFVGYKWGKTRIDIEVSGASGPNINKSTTKLSIEESIAAPTTLIQVASDPKDWLTETNNDLWGHSADKTIYDPCPAGYRVPDRDTDDPLWQTVTNLTQFSSSSNSTGHWWKLGSVVFPYTGYYYYSSGNIDGEYKKSYLWSAEAHSTEGYGQAQYVYDNSGTWASQPGWGLAKSSAAPIRCVKIEGEVPEPEEQPITQGPTSITIDGSFSDWTDVEATVTSSAGPYYEFKVAYDATYVYFYSKRDNRSSLWGDAAGYYYYLMDLDHDKTTQASSNQGIAGVDKFVYLYIFGGSSDAPVINGAPSGQNQEWAAYTCAENSCAGAIGASYVETELRLPRADFGIEKDQQVKFYSYGNKDASNIKTIHTYLKIEN